MLEVIRPKDYLLVLGTLPALNQIRMEVRTHGALIGLFALLLGTVWSCATATNDEASVRDTEAKLEDAGFTKVLVDTPSEDLAQLPTFKLNQYQTASSMVFWYYDPDYCRCLFEGNQAEADRYDLAQYQENETEESVAQQGLMASAFNGAVPSPFFWGGWGAWYGYGVGYYGGSGGYRGGGLHNPKLGGGTGKGGGLGGGGRHIGGGGHGFGGGRGFGHGGVGHSGGHH